MEFPNNLKYSKEHTWLLIEGETGTVGITEFAQSELGEIVYVDLPNTGKSFKQDEVFGSVEAVKTVSDLFMPVSGNVIEINKQVVQQPTLVNESPFEKGWMLKIKITHADEINNLLTSEQYQQLSGQ
ncbi:glycine cleavage system protein H [Chitinophagaceae bacterium IBVUCB2]|nr:glycine cleavage system protein H [Chitinophagaceae bacterium IBVUCB2]